MVKRLRHRPFTAVLWVQIPLGSLVIIVFQSYADVAQLAEQLICNQQVVGSSPIISFHLSSGDFSARFLAGKTRPHNRFTAGTFSSVG